MPKVSVIMPSLNVKKYILKCLDSVVQQTFFDIEILIVDGGSTDGTLEICREYAEKDERVRIINADMKSYGYQMNLGLKEAQGMYIAFLETDDFYCPYALERLYDIITSDGMDYVKGTTYSFWENKNGRNFVQDDDKICLVLPIEEEVFSPRDYPRLLINDYHVWNGLYKREFLKNIRFNETKGAAFQDIGFIVQCITQAKAARYVDLPVYWYRRSNDNSSVYNQSGFRYLADEYERIAQIGDWITESQWLFIWYRLLIQTLTRFETMYKSGKMWPAMETDLQRLRVLLQQAEEKNLLREVNEKDIYGQLLKLILEGRYDILKTADWMYASVKRIIDAFEKDALLIYGAGRRGRMVMAAALKNGMWPPIAFVDSNPQKWGEIVAGTRIISLTEAREKYPEAKYMLAVKGHEREIEKTLLEAGVEQEHIVCFDVDAVSWQKYVEKYN